MNDNDDVFLFDLIYIADCFVFRYAVLVGNKKKTTADGNNDKNCLCVCVCVCLRPPFSIVTLASTALAKTFITSFNVFLSFFSKILFHKNFN